MEAAKDLKPITIHGHKENKNIFHKLINWKIGVIPFPLYIALALIVFWQLTLMNCRMTCSAVSRSL